MNFKYCVMRSYESRSYVTLGLMSVGPMSVGLMSVGLINVGLMKHHLNNKTNCFQRSFTVCFKNYGYKIKLS